MNAAEIHARIAWPETLLRLGIAPEFLCSRHGPCPACGGRDRYRFTNRYGRGDYFCNQCGAGDGFTLVQRVLGVGFPEARRLVLHATRLGPDTPLRSRARAAESPADPTARVRRLLATTTRPESVPACVAYLESRALWPLPDGCTLEAHPAVEYWDSTGDRPVLRGAYPALVARVVDVAGALATAHATYLTSGGQKLEPTPRKLLGAVRGRVGCAVRLVQLRGAVLGICEGIETGLAVMALHALPCWAATNAGLLAKFTPPEGVRRVVVFADRDSAGLDAANRLARRLRGRVAVDIRAPRAPAKDWADALAAQAEKENL